MCDATAGTAADYANGCAGSFPFFISEKNLCLSPFCFVMTETSRSVSRVGRYGLLTQGKQYTGICNNFEKRLAAWRFPWLQIKIRFFFDFICCA